MKRQMLESLADRIEATLARHKLSVRITGGHISPRWIQFQAVPTLGTRISKLKRLSGELALALDMETCRISTLRDKVLIEIPRPDKPAATPPDDESMQLPDASPTLPFSAPPIRSRHRERIDL